MSKKLLLTLGIISVAFIGCDKKEEAKQDEHQKEAAAEHHAAQAEHHAAHEAKENATPAENHPVEAHAEAAAPTAETAPEKTAK